MSKFKAGFWDGATFGFYVLFVAATLLVTYYNQIEAFILSRQAVSEVFQDFVKRIYARQKRVYKPKLIMAFDPGETTGFAVMHCGEILCTAQIDTPPNDIKACWDRIDTVYDLWVDRARLLDSPYEVSCEDYRIYAHKSDSHRWSSVHTIKVVGLIQLMTQQKCRYAPIRMRMAAAAKGFVTDEKLKVWDFYDDTMGMKHSRDAVRHAIFHQCFPSEEDKAFMPEDQPSTKDSKIGVDKTAERVRQGKSIF